MSDLDYQTIVEMLNDHAEDIAFECLSGAKREGQRIWGDCGGKTSVKVAGHDRGLVGFWQGQRGDKQGGNLVNLIELANGMDHGSAVRYAKQKYLGIQDRPFTDEEKRQWGLKQREMERKREKEREEAERLRRRKEGDVRLIWNDCVPVKGTAAETYLKRRIGDYPWPPSLRFHPSMKCEPAKAAGMAAEWPALVAGVQNVDRALIAVWRIFLKPDGSNLVVDGQKVKLGFGPAAGGAVRLGPVGPEWNVGEGLESTLAAMALHGFKGGWAACLSTSGMRGLAIPPVVQKLKIFLDQDRPRPDKADGVKILPSPGWSAAEALQKRAGIECSIHHPMVDGDDWCDVLATKRARDLEE